MCGKNCNASIYYAKYKKEEKEIKALIKLMKEGVAEVTTREVKNVNTRSVTLEHCFGYEKTQETIRRRKTPK